MYVSKDVRIQGYFSKKQFGKHWLIGGPNSTEHDFATFYAVCVTSAKCSLHSAKMKYCTQNEEWISTRTIVCSMYVCTYIDVCVYIYIYIYNVTCILNCISCATNYDNNRRSFFNMQSSTNARMMSSFTTLFTVGEQKTFSHK